MPPGAIGLDEVSIVREGRVGWERTLRKGEERRKHRCGEKVERCVRLGDGRVGRGQAQAQAQGWRRNEGRKVERLKDDCGLGGLGCLTVVVIR